jgi:creatinine amidohydrolase
MVGFVSAGVASFATKTAPEISEIAERPGSTLVVPVGSIEQHGNHLPVATDTLLASEVANESADRLVTDDGLPLLVTPPVWTGHSPHHLPFGGTLAGEFDTLLDLLEEVVETGLENGFDAVLLVNGHGGNTSLIGAAVSNIGTGHPDVEALGITYFQLAEAFIEEIRESDIGGMGHGGEFETSLMLHLHPELVREAKAGTYMDEPYDHGDEDLLAAGALSVYRSFDEYSDSGAIGDPDPATAEKGEQIFDGVVDELTSLLRQIHERNR